MTSDVGLAVACHDGCCPAGFNVTQVCTCLQAQDMAGLVVACGCSMTHLCACMQGGGRYSRPEVRGGHHGAAAAGKEESHHGGTSSSSGSRSGPGPCCPPPPCRFRDCR